MQYIILLANCFFILYSILFFADHKFIPKEMSARIRNLLLMCAAIYVSYNVLFIYILEKENEQSGIIYKIVWNFKNVALNSYAFIQPFQKEFIIAILLAAIISIVSFILVGLPGGIIMKAIQKAGFFNKIEGDNTWSAALYISFLWPLCFPFAVVIKNYCIQQGYVDYELLGLWFSGIIWVLTIVSSTFLLFANNNK